MLVRDVRRDNLKGKHLLPWPYLYRFPTQTSITLVPSLWMFWHQQVLFQINPSAFRFANKDKTYSDFCKNLHIKKINKKMQKSVFDWISPILKRQNCLVCRYLLVSGSRNDASKIFAHLLLDANRWIPVNLNSIQNC